MLFETRSVFSVKHIHNRLRLCQDWGFRFFSYINDLTQRLNKSSFKNCPWRKRQQSYGESWELSIVPSRGDPKGLICSACHETSNHYPVASHVT